MSQNIEVKESLIDDKSMFNIKSFKFGELNINRPTKTLDATVLNRKIFDEIKKDLPNIIIEYSKSISLKSIIDLLNESKDLEITKFFGYRNWMSDYPFISANTFNFNPYKKFKNLEEISGYFSYYYHYMNTALFVPNIKIYIYDPNTGKKEQIINLDTYMKFVNDAYEILNYRNEKPIFVPVSLRFGIEEIKKLANFYLKNEFFNIWIDFEGFSITRPKISRVSTFIKEFEKNEFVRELIIFSTNIRREISPNLNDDKTNASDILGSLIGSNLIGVNKEPRRPLNSKEDIDKNSLRQHKARIFEASTYYYVKASLLNCSSEFREKLMKKDYNIIYNSHLLDKEFESQANYFYENRKIKDYIAKKDMVKEYKDGEFLKILFSEKNKKITEWS